METRSTGPLRPRRISLPLSQPFHYSLSQFRDEMGLQSLAFTNVQSEIKQVASIPLSGPSESQVALSQLPTPAKRPRRKWSDEETKMLVDGCNVWGVGNWKAILNDPQFKFGGRTPVDLKDRFRTYFPDAYRHHYPNARTHLSSRVRSAHPDGSSIFEKTRSKKRRPFSADEDTALRRGYEKHGALWAVIAKDPVFQYRRSTDLRDRFRNAFPELYTQAGYKPRPAKVKKTLAGTHSLDVSADIQHLMVENPVVPTPQHLETEPGSRLDLKGAPSFTYPPFAVRPANELAVLPVNSPPGGRLPTLFSENTGSADSLSVSSQTWDSEYQNWSSSSGSPSSISRHRSLLNHPLLPVNGKRTNAVGKSPWGTNEWLSANPRLSIDRGFFHGSLALSSSDEDILDKYDLSAAVQDYHSEVGLGAHSTFSDADTFSPNHFHGFTHHHYAGDLIFGSGVAVHPPLLHSGFTSGFGTVLNQNGFSERLAQRSPEEPRPRDTRDLHSLPMSGANIEVSKIRASPRPSLPSNGAINPIGQTADPILNPRDPRWTPGTPDFRADSAYSTGSYRSFSQPPSEHRHSAPLTRSQLLFDGISTTLTTLGPAFSCTHVAALDLHHYPTLPQSGHRIESMPASVAHAALDLAAITMQVAQPVIEPVTMLYSSQRDQSTPLDKVQTTTSTKNGRRTGVRKRLSWDGHSEM